MSNLNLFSARVELLVPMKVLPDTDKFEQLVPVKLFDWQQLEKAREFSTKTEGQLYTWQDEDCANFLNKGAHWVNALFVAIVPSEYQLPDFVELHADSGFICSLCSEGECQGECHHPDCECPDCPHDGCNCQFCGMFCGNLADKDCHETKCKHNPANKPSGSGGDGNVVPTIATEQLQDDGSQPTPVNSDVITDKQLRTIRRHARRLNIDAATLEAQVEKNFGKAIDKLSQSDAKYIIRSFRD